MRAPDGLFIWPYNVNDWIVISMAVCGYLYRMLLWRRTPDTTNPNLRDWVSTFVITAILTVGLYEMAIRKKWDMAVFFLPFGVSIILVKDISDWLFMSKEGRRYTLSIFKEIISGILGKFGYEKKE